MRDKHLLIPQMNIVEADYISLIDIILGLEEISKHELLSLEYECTQQLDKIKEHPINDAE
jgi:hypothetical protein